MNKSEIKLIRKDNNLNRKSNIEYQIDYLDKNDYLREQKLKPRIDTLQEGQIFDNWLHLFDYLDLYYPSDGSKRELYQKRIKRWGIIEKYKGNKIVIKELYTEPIEWEDGRKSGNNSLYITLLSTLLLWRLLHEDGYTIEVTYNQFWNLMGMRNSYYSNKDVRKMLPKVDKDMTPEFLEDFFKWTSSKNKSITDYTLDRLQDKGYLKYQKQRMIKEEGHPARLATRKEDKDISSEETRVMKAMGYSSRKDLFISGKFHELYNKVKKNIGVSYFDVLSISIFDQDVLAMGIIEGLEEIQNYTQMSEIEKKKELNKQITTYDLNSAKKRQDKEFNRLDVAYEEYKDSFALGKPDTKEVFISSNGYEILTDKSYIAKFKKATHYFNDLKVSGKAKENILRVEELIEAEKIRDLEELKSKDADE